MVYNPWNNPEEEMERSAIDHYLDKLDKNNVLVDWQNILMNGTISIQGFIDTLSDQLHKHWNVDMYWEPNQEYLRDQVDERIKQFGFNLGKDIW